MSIEIDMLSVGDADALALRYFYPNGSTFVAVIDGGNTDDGQKLVNLINTYYRTSYIDLVVSTHPDHDHIAGLSSVVASFTIGRVWVHDPSLHSAANLKHSIAMMLYKASGVQNIATKSTDDLESFLRLVDRLGITREEPFSGCRYGPMTVLGPSVEFYELMLSETDYSRVETDLAAKALEEDSGYAIDDNNETSPINNTSTIIHLNDAGRAYLFTGDAGVQALDDARSRWNFSGIHWLDTPHHGSRRNLSSSLVEYLNPTLAYVSATGSVKHPSAAVVNALKRVNATVYSTHKSGSLWHHNGTVPSRTGYVTAEPL